MAESYVTSLIELDENAILTQLNSIAQELGLIKEVFTTSRIYIHYAVFARVFGNLTQIIAQYYDNIDIDSTTDEALLELQIKPFVEKRYAKVAKVILEFSRRKDFDKTSHDIIINRNMEVSTEDENPIIFRLAEGRIFRKDSSKIYIPAYSVEYGAFNNVAENTLTFFDDAEFFDEIEVTNPNPAYGGTDEETSFDARERIGLFRNSMDSTLDALRDILYANGIYYNNFNIVEFYSGLGTLLIAMDVDSEDEFYDIIALIESIRPGVVKYEYCMVDHVDINITVTVKMVSEDMYTLYEKSEIEETIKNAIESYFANHMYVGRKLSINRLESYILQYLFDERYDIYEVEIEVENNAKLSVDEETGQLKIKQFEKIVPNLIYTNVEYNIDA